MSFLASQLYGAKVLKKQKAFKKWKNDAVYIEVTNFSSLNRPFFFRE